MSEYVIKNINNEKDLISLSDVYEVSFGEQYTKDVVYLKKILENHSAVLVGVYDGEKVIGGLIAFEMNPIRGHKELYIYDIAIHPDFQRQGLGKKLMEYIFEYGKQNTIKTVFVEAESEDTDAVLFYRSLNGEEMKVSHFNFNL